MSHTVFDNMSYLVTRCDTEKLGKKFLGGNDVEAVPERLDRLTVLPPAMSQRLQATSPKPPVMLRKPPVTLRKPPTTLLVPRMMLPIPRTILLMSRTTLRQMLPTLLIPRTILLMSRTMLRRMLLLPLLIFVNTCPYETRLSHTPVSPFLRLPQPRNPMFRYLRI